MSLEYVANLCLAFSDTLGGYRLECNAETFTWEVEVSEKVFGNHTLCNHKLARSESVISKGKVSDLLGLRAALLGLKYLVLLLSLNSSVNIA